MKQQCVLLLKARRCATFIGGLLLAAASLLNDPQIVRADDDGGWQTVVTIKSPDWKVTDQGASFDSSLRASLGGPRGMAANPVAKPPRLHPLIGLTWYAKSTCVPEQLRAVLNELVATFGPIAVTSTCRGMAQNRAAGGAEHSYHLHGQAIDFLILGAAGAVYAHLAASPHVGGLKHYGGGLFHIDLGPKRTW